MISSKLAAVGLKSLSWVIRAHRSGCREMLVKLVRTGSHPAQQVRRARILLELDENDPGRDGPVPTQEVVAQRAGVHVDTVLKTSRAYAERGGEVEATISRKKRLTPPVEPKVTGEVEARLIALACSTPPACRRHDCPAHRIVRQQLQCLGAGQR